MKHRKKAFTLIELIVIISVIGILVTLGIIAFKGYTKEARRAEYLNNIKVLENASEQYYLDNGDWPRLTEEHFTSEQLATYAEKIYDITGETPILETDGKYYEINYKDVAKYVQIPRDKGNYILQNPVGKVMYLENINETGEENLTNYTTKETETKETETIVPEKPIVFHGLEPYAFDGDSTTNTSLVGEVTWEGNLANKKIKIDSYYYSTFKIYDSAGNQLKFINLTNRTEIDIIRPHASRETKEIIVPEGAVKFIIGKDSGSSRLYDITVESLEHPKSITNVKSTATNSSITLTWENTSLDYEKVIIYKDGLFHKIINGKTYVDKPLHANSDHTYKLKAVNTQGNASVGWEIISERTRTPEIIFSGVGPGAFDGDTLTDSLYNVTGNNITWTGDLYNKKISVGIHYSTTFKIYDSAGKEMKFISLTDNKEVSSITTSMGTTTKSIIVPEGAVKFVVSGSSSGKVIDIITGEILEHPNNITNLQSSSTNSSITLNWENSDPNYEKSVIYRDGNFLAIVGGKEYTDKPLHASSNHEYEIHAINSYGNASKYKVKHTERTQTPEIIFSGVGPGAFDGDPLTNSLYNVNGNDITWTGNLDNKKISVGVNYYTTFKIYDINGNILAFNNLTDNTTINQFSSGGGTTTKQIIVPEGAVKFMVSGSSSGKVIDITVIE